MAMNYIATDMNLDSLQRQIKRLQTTFSCKICKQRYERPWCPADESSCLFCIHFHPTKHTRQYILRESEWHFIRSGEENRVEFNRNYIHQMHKWCNRYHIPLTSEDIAAEDELIA